MQLTQNVTLRVQNVALWMQSLLYRVKVSVRGFSHLQQITTSVDSFYLKHLILELGYARKFLDTTGLEYYSWHLT